MKYEKLFEQIVRIRGLMTNEFKLMVHQAEYRSEYDVLLLCVTFRDNEYQIPVIHLNENRCIDLETIRSYLRGILTGKVDDMVGI